MHWPGAPFNSHLKADLLLGSDFVLYEVKHLFDIRGGTALGRTQSLERVSAVVNHLTDNLLDMGERGLYRQVFRHAVKRDVELHRGTDYALQEGIMEFLCDLSPLRKSILKATLDPFVPRLYPVVMEGQRHSHECHST